VGIHLVGGLIGTLYIGLLGNNVGLFFGFGAAQLGKQAIAAFAVLIYSFVLSFVIAWIIEKTMGFRVKNEDEIAGIDTVVHGEEGYILLEETR
jgi:Amt family ammonium transporter